MYLLYSVTLSNLVAIFLIAVHQILILIAKDKVNPTLKYAGFMFPEGWVFTIGMVTPSIGENFTRVSTMEPIIAPPPLPVVVWLFCHVCVRHLHLNCSNHNYVLLGHLVESKIKPETFNVTQRRGNPDDERSICKEQHTANHGKVHLATMTYPKRGHVPRSESSQAVFTWCLLDCREFFANCML